MKGRLRGKKRQLRNKSVPIDHPGRGQYIVESMRIGRCPDCQTKLIELTDPDLEEMKEDGAKAFECPKCHWQGVVGDSQNEDSITPFPVRHKSNNAL
jgi:hypothetical protein